MRRRRDGYLESSGQGKKTSTQLSAHTPASSLCYRDTLRESANLSRLARPSARLSWAYRRARLSVLVLLSHSSAIWVTCLGSSTLELPRFRKETKDGDFRMRVNCSASLCAVPLIPLQRDSATRTTNIDSFCHTKGICQHQIPQMFEIYILCVDLVDNVHNNMGNNPFWTIRELENSSNGQIVENVEVENLAHSSKGQNSRITYDE